MAGQVICGVEDAASSAGAIEVARELAGRFDLPLLFVHIDAANQDVAVELGRAVEHSYGLDAAALTERGHPADRLVELATDHEACFLVVGSHGPRSSLLGSVSAEVSRRAPCPVVVVPPHARSVRALGAPGQAMAAQRG